MLAGCEPRLITPPPLGLTTKVDHPLNPRVGRAGAVPGRVGSGEADADGLLRAHVRGAAQRQVAAAGIA